MQSCQGTSSSSGNVEDLCKATAKLAMATAKQVASLEANMYDTFLLPEKPGSLGEKLAQVGIDYDKESKQMKARQAAGENVHWKARGSPHIRLFAEALHWMWKASAKDGSLPDEEFHAVVLDFWKNVVMGKTAAQLEEVCKQFRYRKGRATEEGDKFGVLAIAFAPKGVGVKLAAPVVGYLKLLEGSQVLAGAAPRGPLEREAARHLQAVDKGKD